MTRSRSTNKLSATGVEKLKWDDPANPRDGKKAKNKHTDGDGMYLLVKKPSAGSKDTPKYWHMDYYRPITKKRNTLAFGTYPEVTLEQARKKRDEARKLIADDIDPAEHREVVKQQKLSEHANTFEVLAAEFLALRAKESGKANKDKEIKRRLNHDVLPYIGKIPYTKITTDMLKEKVFNRIVERNTLSVSKKVKRDLMQIFELALPQKIATNPAKYVKIPEYKGGNFKAITDPDELVQMFRDIWDSDNPTQKRKINLVAKLVKLSVLNFLRPTEIRSLEWASYKRDRQRLELVTLKTDDRGRQIKHIVPLSRQSMDILDSLFPFTGATGYVFYSGQGKKEPFYTENTVNNALKKLGYQGKQTAHGLRATATTVIDEILGFRPDWINLQLAHVVKDPNGTAYNRTKHLAKRTEMMQVWADYIDDLRNGTKFVPVVEYDIPEDDE